MYNHRHRVFAAVPGTQNFLLVVELWAVSLHGGVAGASAREAPQNPGHPNLPPPVHRRLRLAQPAATFLNRQTLCQSEQYVGDIDWVCGEQSGIGAPLDSPVESS
jgi:hypothetical protein